MKGVGVSPGIAIGRAFVIERGDRPMPGIFFSGDPNTVSEIKKFDQALRIALAEVKAILLNTDLNLQTDEIEILEMQIKFLSDPQVRADVVHRIENEHDTAHDSLTLVIRQLVAGYQNGDNMKVSSADIQDVGNRLLKHLNSSFNNALTPSEKNTIIIAEDISPSDAITIDLQHVIGLATMGGSKTSHTAILAKAKGIPAVVGCGDRLGLIKNNDMIILDGKTGQVLVNPGADSLSEYIRLRTEHTRMSEALKSLLDIPAVTADGTEITLLGNISDAHGLRDVFANGGQGVGLFRTEMLFMRQNSLPSEDEQFEFYREVAENSNDRPVIVRTMDIGDDKQINYSGLSGERNPFLGPRAIRRSLDRPDLMRAQLKAILRASVYGNFKIMFPMISNVSELRAAKEILEQSREELRTKGISFDEAIQTGIMIEIPSAAITADILAKDADFFSIGTNDLCQYTLAVDRMNEKTGHLHSTFNPAILRLMKYTIEQAEKNNIHVGICGEMASDPIAIRLLLGMGFRELSMNAGSIAGVKEIILNTCIRQATELCAKVMEMDSPEMILSYLREQNNDL